MKKFLLFAVAVLVGFVVGASEPQRQIKVPDSLPIGTGFPPPNTHVWIIIGFDDPEQVDPFRVDVLYQTGDLAETAKQEVAKAAGKFSPRLGHERETYYIDVDIVQVIDEERYDWYPIGWSHGRENQTKLVQVNGKWVVPPDAVEKVVVGFQGSLCVDALGLSEVQLTYTDELGNEYYTETSPNGVTDKTCTEYPGGSAYLGPDVLKVSMGIAYATLYKGYRDWKLLRGYYYLTFGAAKATWAKYDLQTGLKLASNEPPVPLTLAISLVQLDDTGKITLLSKKSLRWGLKLSVSGPMGKPASIEYADTAVGGQWTPLTKLSMTYGSGEFVEPVVSTAPTRFYRVR